MASWSCLVGEDQAFQKTCLRILRILGQKAVGAVERTGQVALAELLVDVLDFIGQSRQADEEGAGDNGGEKA
jgi:hypothetical protein